MFELSVLKVNFLFATKLKQKAQKVEMIFADTTGSPSDFKVKSTLKSMAVLIPPIAIKRIFCELFFIATLVVFLNKIEWTILRFIEDPADVFANHAK